MHGRKLAKNSRGHGQCAKNSRPTCIRNQPRTTLRAKKCVSATKTGRMSADRPWIGIYQMKTANIDVEKTAYTKVL